MIDPNPINSGRGILILRAANIEIEMFPKELVEEIEEMNREFIRASKVQDIRLTIDSDFALKNMHRSLDQWYRSINTIYWNRNFNRDASDIFTHLVEVFGGLSLFASEKNKPNVEPEKFVAKTLAWWMALCAKMGVADIEQLIWNKYPGVCPYCRQEQHKSVICKQEKAKNPNPSWSDLARIGKDKQKPKDLLEWQQMFHKIFPAGDSETYASPFGRLSEELGELAETIRVFPENPGYFLSEAADVFAWLMHIQNIVDYKKGTAEGDFGKNITNNLALAYPDFCMDCGKNVCSCPPILSSTVKRIAHDVPQEFKDQGIFMRADEIKKKFSWQ